MKIFFILLLPALQVMSHGIITTTQLIGETRLIFNATCPKSEPSSLQIFLQKSKCAEMIFHKYQALTAVRGQTRKSSISLNEVYQHSLHQTLTSCRDIRRKLHAEAKACGRTPSKAQNQSENIVDTLTDELLAIGDGFRRKLLFVGHQLNDLSLWSSQNVYPAVLELDAYCDGKAPCTGLCFPYGDDQTTALDRACKSERRFPSRLDELRALTQLSERMGKLENHLRAGLQMVQKAKERQTITAMWEMGVVSQLIKKLEALVKSDKDEWQPVFGSSKWEKFGLWWWWWW